MKYLRKHALVKKYHLYFRFEFSNEWFDDVPKDAQYYFSNDKNNIISGILSFSCIDRKLNVETISKQVNSSLSSKILSLSSKME